MTTFQMAYRGTAGTFWLSQAPGAAAHFALWIIQIEGYIYTQYNISSSTIIRLKLSFDQIPATRLTFQSASALLCV